MKNTTKRVKMVPIYLIFIMFFVILYLWITIFLRIGLTSLPKGDIEQGHKFSVIIAARNEEDLLKESLTAVLNQNIDSNRFEVIVANDRSTDKTQEIVISLIPHYKNLSLVNITDTPNGISPKKHALSEAIKTSKNEIIVFTDADCFVGNRWLETIDKNFFASIDLVQGITTYRPDDTMNALFFGLQSIDFLSHGITAAAAIGADIPINSNANNFAFRKSAFDKVSGFDSDKGIISADDDMILQKIWNPNDNNIQFMTDQAGAVETRPTPTLRELLEQRKRWGSNTSFYKPIQKTVLGGIFSFYVIIFITLISTFFNSSNISLLIFLLGIKILGELIIMIPGTAIFMKRHLRKYILPATILQLPLVIYAVFFGTFGKFNWKGQVFKSEV